MTRQRGKGKLQPLPSSRLRKKPAFFSSVNFPMTEAKRTHRPANGIPVLRARRGGAQGFCTTSVNVTVCHLHPWKGESVCSDLHVGLRLLLLTRTPPVAGSESPRDVSYSLGPPVTPASGRALPWLGMLNSRHAARKKPVSGCYTGRTPPPTPGLRINGDENHQPAKPGVLRTKTGQRPEQRDQPAPPNHACSTHASFPASPCGYADRSKPSSWKSLSLEPLFTAWLLPGQESLL